jgi:hypothetical protein
MAVELTRMWTIAVTKSSLCVYVREWRILTLIFSARRFSARGHL